MTEEEQADYDDGIADLEKARTTGKGYLLAIDKGSSMSLYIQKLNTNDLANIVRMITVDKPEILPMLVMHMLKNQQQKDAHNDH